MLEVLILKPCPDSRAITRFPSKNGKQDIILFSALRSIVRDIGSPNPLPEGSLFAETQKNLPLSAKKIILSVVKACILNFSLSPSLYLISTSSFK